MIWLDPSLLRTVRDLLHSASGQVGPAFALIDLDDGGLRGAAVDSATGQCLMQLDDHDLQGRAFDRSVADYLVRTGKAPMPENPEWARELLDLMTKARSALRWREREPSRAASTADPVDQPAAARASSRLQ